MLVSPQRKILKSELVLTLMRKKVNIFLSEKANIWELVKSNACNPLLEYWRPPMKKMNIFFFKQSQEKDQFLEPFGWEQAALPRLVFLILFLITYIFFTYKRLHFETYYSEKMLVYPTSLSSLWLKLKKKVFKWNTFYLRFV